MISIALEIEMKELTLILFIYNLFYKNKMNFIHTTIDDILTI